MSEQGNTIIFPLDEIQSEFLQARNARAIESVRGAVALVRKAINVPEGMNVAPNNELTALVVASEEQQAPIEPPEVSPDEVEQPKDPIDPKRLQHFITDLRDEFDTLRNSVENTEKLSGLGEALVGLEHWVNAVTELEGDTEGK